MSWKRPRLAGIMAAKRTGERNPLVPSAQLTAVRVDLHIRRGSGRSRGRGQIDDRTGVEMEALVAASTALLTIYDMCKGVDRGMVISELRLVEKRGGRSGTWVAGRGVGRANRLGDNEPRRAQERAFASLSNTAFWLCRRFSAWVKISERSSCKSAPSIS